MDHPAVKVCGSSHYLSPLGTICLTADERGLTGLWFETEKDSAVSSEAEDVDLPVFDETKRWLDLYFAGQDPGFFPPIHLVGTDFQLEVWDLLQKIPYGETVSYGELAVQIAAKRGSGRMSAQAVGGAVGHNPVAIIVPCHRVIGSDGSLIGYAGGLERKTALLKGEGFNRPEEDEKQHGTRSGSGE